ncbi:MAG TPA: ATP-binding protein [Acidobacteriota bacterium]|nr:ATP-binding protein [Acidobacteriota bacterium]
MLWPAPVSFRAQAFIIAAASLAVVCLAAFIVRDVIFTTESKLLADSQQLCIAASQELRTQYQEHSAYAGALLKDLPHDAQEVSLMGISATVLKAYKGIKGGMFQPGNDTIMGYAFPTAVSGSESELKEIERVFIRSLAHRAVLEDALVTQSEWYDRDLIVGAAERSGEVVLWTMCRVPALRYPLMGTQRWWLTALVFSTVLGVGGIITIWYMLHSGVAGIRNGLRHLEDNFSYRLPQIRGDLGQVVQAINLMAERRAALEEKLRQQDRLAALGKVVAGVAHEVRNPLNSIKLTLQLLDRRLKKGIAGSNEVEECLQEIDRLDMIVGRLLSFGRPVMTNRHTQEIEPLIQQAIKMVHEPMHQKSVQIAANEIESGMEADVDGPQIIQVLINLLLNAIEASPSSRTVRLAAESLGPNICIRVSDEGARIPEEVRQHVFDAYYTTKPNGSGLGLAVSREIVVNHGGALEFESEDTGTTFILLLPIERSPFDEI